MFKVRSRLGDRERALMNLRDAILVSTSNVHLNSLAPLSRRINDPPKRVSVGANSRVILFPYGRCRCRCSHFIRWNKRDRTTYEVARCGNGNVCVLLPLVEPSLQPCHATSVASRLVSRFRPMSEKNSNCVCYF